MPAFWDEVPTGKSAGSNGPGIWPCLIVMIVELTGLAALVRIGWKLVKK